MNRENKRDRIIDTFLISVSIAIVVYFVIGSVAFIFGAHEQHRIHKELSGIRQELKVMNDSIQW